MKMISLFLILSLLLCGCTVAGTEPAPPPTTAATVPPTTEATVPPATEATAPPTTEATVPPTTQAPPTQPPADPAWLAGSAQADMANPAYWGGNDALVLDSEEIAALNAQFLATPGTGLRELTAVPETLSGSEIRALVEQ